MNLIATDKTWDVVLPQATADNLLQLIDGAAKHFITNKGSQDQLHHMLLFYGSCRQNRIAAAALAGMRIGKQTCRIDLSAVLSQYIGQTEKNINTIFTEAANNDWILFFDEADALFGKRTDIKDSHDKYANAALNYLLQKIEAFNGLVMVAADNKEHLPSWLLRKFTQVVYFPDII